MANPNPFSDEELETYRLAQVCDHGEHLSEEEHRFLDTIAARDKRIEELEGENAALLANFPEVVAFDIETGKPEEIIQCSNCAALTADLSEAVGLMEEAKDGVVFSQTSHRGRDGLVSVVAIKTEAYRGIAAYLARHANTNTPEVK